MDGCSLGSGGVDAYAITKGKDILESLVLESIRVDINYSFLGSNT